MVVSEFSRESLLFGVAFLGESIKVKETSENYALFPYILSISLA